MINFISISGDWNYNLYIIFNSLTKILHFSMILVLICFMVMALKSKETITLRNLVGLGSEGPYWSFIILCFLTIFAASSALLNFKYGGKSIGSDKWVTLAQAESTIIQLKVSSDLQKKPLSFNREKSDAWIKELRERVASGDIDYIQFKKLVNDYNELYIGSDDIKSWFKTNSTESIREELKNNVNASVNNAPMQTPQPTAEQTTQPEQAEMSMEQQLNDAMN